MNDIILMRCYLYLTNGYKSYNRVVDTLFDYHRVKKKRLITQPYEVAMQNKRGELELFSFLGITTPT